MTTLKRRFQGNRVRNCHLSYSAYVELLRETYQSLWIFPYLKTIDFDREIALSGRGIGEFPYLGSEETLSDELRFKEMVLRFNEVREEMKLETFKFNPSNLDLYYPEDDRVIEFNSYFYSNNGEEVELDSISNEALRLIIKTPIERNRADMTRMVVRKGKAFISVGHRELALALAAFNWLYYLDDYDTRDALANVFRLHNDSLRYSFRKTIADVKYDSKEKTKVSLLDPKGMVYFNVRGREIKTLFQCIMISLPNHKIELKFLRQISNESIGVKYAILNCFRFQSLKHFNRMLLKNPSSITKPLMKKKG